MFKYFQLSDFDCQETGENEMSPDFIHRLDHLRDCCAFPFVVYSGYRSPKHSLECTKVTPGTHAQGIAADIRCTEGINRRKLVRLALEQGFGGVGTAKSYVHIDDRKTIPVLWTY